MDTAFSTVDVKLHQFSLRSSTSRAPLLTPTQTLANTCITSLLPYHTYVCTYVHLYAMYVVPGYRGMAGMYSRGEPFGTYHTLNGVTTLSVVSPHSQWCHHTLNGVTTLLVVSPHSGCRSLVWQASTHHLHPNLMHAWTFFHSDCHRAQCPGFWSSLT